MSEPGDLKGRAAKDWARQRRLGNRAIGDRLRSMYEGVVDESVPDEFLKLLDEAEQNERGAKADESSDTSETT